MKYSAEPAWTQEWKIGCMYSECCPQKTTAKWAGYKETPRAAAIRPNQSACRRSSRWPSAKSQPAQPKPQSPSQCTGQTTASPPHAAPTAAYFRATGFADIPPAPAQMPVRTHLRQKCGAKDWAGGKPLQKHPLPRPRRKRVPPPHHG